MKPNSYAVVRAPKRIFNGQSRHGILERKESVYHRKTEEVYSQ